jgi:Ca2+-binding EF-hand superfamily protein
MIATLNICYSLYRSSAHSLLSCMCTTEFTPKRNKLSSDLSSSSNHHLQRSIATDRMGYTIVALKNLFDSKCASSSSSSQQQHVISPDTALGMLLDLRLGNTVFSKARSVLQRDQVKQLDFRAFLQLYIPYTGLAQQDVDAAQEQQQEQTSWWIPTVDGTWCAVDLDLVDKIRRAASPFNQITSSRHAVSQASIFLLPSDDRSGDIRVKADDILDILMLAGYPIQSEDLETAFQVFQSFFSNQVGDRYSLQDLVMIEHYLEVSVKQQQALHEKSTRRIMLSTWKLPYIQELNNSGSGSKHKAVEELRNEFRRLDLLGEGRLTFLTLKAALELAEVQESEERIRDWLRCYDRGKKGYIDLTDYLAIYASAVSDVGGGDQDDQDVLLSSQRRAFLLRNKQIPSQAQDQTSGQASDQASLGQQSHGQGQKQHQSQHQQQRMTAIRNAFDKYDHDGDGLISAEDLKHTLTSHGELSLTECEAWIRRRDRAGTGALTFEDFAFFYL